MGSENTALGGQDNTDAANGENGDQGDSNQNNDANNSDGLDLGLGTKDVEGGDDSGDKGTGDKGTGDKDTKGDKDKSTEGDGDNGDGDNGDKENKQLAPDKYEDFAGIEGFELNEETLTEFTELAKESNLTQEQAQKFVDMQSKMIQAQTESLVKQGEDWLTEAKGHYGDNYDENLAVAGKGLEYMFGEDSSEIKKILDNTQLGNNLTFIKAFALVGSQISEGKFVPGNGGQHTKKTAAQTIFPNRVKKEE